MVNYNCVIPDDEWVGVKIIVKSVVDEIVVNDMVILIELIVPWVDVSLGPADEVSWAIIADEESRIDIVNAPVCLIVSGFDIPFMYT